MRYGFVIDLKRCYGCYSCQVMCKAQHLTPPGVFWSRVLRGEGGKYPTSVRQPLPVLCMQCGEPECQKVCPTKATKRREDGIVTIDKDLCIGCKYCMLACPYGSRYFVSKWNSYFPENKNLSKFEEFTKKRWIERFGEGTVTKCDFCIERVISGLKPACIESCSAKARYFGDIDDPESEVSILIKTKRGFPLMSEFGTNPSVYYLPPR